MVSTAENTSSAYLGLELRNYHNKGIIQEHRDWFVKNTEISVQ
jgi:hypothetical protein